MVQNFIKRHSTKLEQRKSQEKAIEGVKGEMFLKEKKKKQSKPIMVHPIMVYI